MFRLDGYLNNKLSIHLIKVRGDSLLKHSGKIYLIIYGSESLTGLDQEEIMITWSNRQRVNFSCIFNEKNHQN